MEDMLGLASQARDSLEISMEETSLTFSPGLPINGYLLLLKWKVRGEPSGTNCLNIYWKGGGIDARWQAEAAGNRHQNADIVQDCTRYI